jgi:hypothetical protein
MVMGKYSGTGSKWVTCAYSVRNTEVDVGGLVFSSFVVFVCFGGVGLFCSFNFGLVFKTGSHYVAQADLKLVILLS